MPRQLVHYSGSVLARSRLRPTATLLGGTTTLLPRGHNPEIPDSTTCTASGPAVWTEHPAWEEKPRLERPANRVVKFLRSWFTLHDQPRSASNWVFPPGLPRITLCTVEVVGPSHSYTTAYRSTPQTATGLALVTWRRNRRGHRVSYWAPKDTPISFVPGDSPCNIAPPVPRMLPRWRRSII